MVVALEEPETVDSDSLSNDADDEEIGKLKGIVGDDAVLESGNHRNRCVKGVSEQKITNQVDKGLLEIVDLAESVAKLPEADCDYVFPWRNLSWLAKLVF